MLSLGVSRKFWLRLVLLLAHLALIPGLWFAVRIGRPRFVGLGLYVVVAIILVDFLLLTSRRVPDTIVASVGDPRILLILLLSNVALLAVLGPGLVFYVGVAALLSLVLVRVVVSGDTSPSPWSDLALLCSTSALIIASQVFTVAYYAKRADTINHTTSTMVLRDGGSLAAISSTRYFLFSALHVLGSIGMEFTNLEPRFVMGVLMILLFQVAILVGYLFFRYWCGSHSLAITATAFLSINISFLHYGSIVHYQSMSFTLFCAFLYLLFRGSWSPRDVVVAVPILLTWIVTHHVSILMAIALIAVPLSVPAVRTLRRHRHSVTDSSVFMFSVLCLMFGIYWTIVTTKFREVVSWLFFGSPAAGGLPNSFYLVRTYRSLETLVRQSLPFLIDSLHYSFLLALTAMGVFVVFSTDLLKERRWRLILLGFLPAAALYFPNPVWIPLEGVIPFGRWRLMVLPFLMLVPALGFRYGMRAVGGGTVRRVGALLFVVAFLFTTVASGTTHPGFADLAGIDKEPREYISDEELSAAEYVLAHMNDGQHAYGRNDYSVYLRQYSWARDRSHSAEQFRQIRASGIDRRLLIEPGLTVVPIDAFRGEGILARVIEVDSERYAEGEMLELSIPVRSEEYAWNRSDANVVYTSGSVAVQQK